MTTPIPLTPEEARRQRIIVAMARAGLRGHARRSRRGREVTTVTIPIKVASAANLREHWRARTKRHGKEKAATRAALLDQLEGWEGMGFKIASVTFTRVGVRLLDSDNLAGGFKAIRDEVARFLGVSDGPETGIAWLYEQERAKGYAARVTVKTREVGT